MKWVKDRFNRLEGVKHTFCRRHPSSQLRSRGNCDSGTLTSKAKVIAVQEGGVDDEEAMSSLCRTVCFSDENL